MRDSIIIDARRAGGAKMPARKPEEIHDLFAQALSAGDVDAVISLYEPDAILAPQPGQVVRGRAAIREALAGYLALKPVFTLQSSKVIQSGDIALLHSKWAITETDPGGGTTELAVQPTQVVRRQPDGVWLVVIDNPSGVELGCRL